MPLYRRGLSVSDPKPLEVSSNQTNPRSRSPIQRYSDIFSGVGPPLPLDFAFDLQPSYNNKRVSSGGQLEGRSNDNTIFPWSRRASHRPSTATTSDLKQNDTKNAIDYEIPATKSFFLAPSVDSFQIYPEVDRKRNFIKSLSRIIHFNDPAETLFYAGFITGPQTWLIGGWYISGSKQKSTTKENGQKQEYNHDSKLHGDIEYSSMARTSGEPLLAQRRISSIWRGRGHGSKEVTFDDSPFILRCRIAAYISGVTLIIVLVLVAVVIATNWKP